MKQLQPLTGLRGIAAYSVLIAHALCIVFTYKGHNVLQPFAARLAYFGMSLFFILSGFVIYYNYSDKIRLSSYFADVYNFFVARFSRLYPLYIVVMLCQIDSIHTHYFDKKFSLMSYLTLTQSWFDMQSLLFAPAWSVSTECFFYLVFVLLVPFITKIFKPFLCFIAVLIVGMLAVPLIIQFQTQSSYFGHSSGWAIYFSPYTRVFEFLLGLMAAKLFIELDWRIEFKRIASVAIIASIIWCVCIIIFAPFTNTRFAVYESNYIYAPAIAIMVILSCQYQNFLSRFLSSRFLQFMGEISYSVYFLQFMIMDGTRGSFGISDYKFISYFNGSIKIFIIIGFSTIFAYGSYELLEKPGKRFMMKLLTLKPSVPGERKVILNDAGVFN